MKVSDITAAILVGGKGSRLKAVVSDRPKILADVGGQPFLSYLLEQLCEAGFRKVVLCSGYLAGQVEAAYGDAYRNLDLFYSREEVPLGTGGAIKNAHPLLKSNFVLVMNGDSYLHTQLKDYIDWFHKKKRQASLLLKYEIDTTRYGRVVIDDQEAVQKFEEKGVMPGPGWINGGIYLLNQDMLKCLPGGRFCSMETEIFPKWIGRGFYGYRVEAKFIDIGTPSTYAQAEDFFGLSASHQRGQGY
ncbi:MAG: NTP transferase domain-containing protein [Phycisphaeraceae bacterium]|nr:NTP transferase domain-containing protein [Phycisphaeraceae bacterium]